MYHAHVLISDIINHVRQVGEMGESPMLELGIILRQIYIFLIFFVCYFSTFGLTRDNFSLACFIER